MCKHSRTLLRVQRDGLEWSVGWQVYAINLRKASIKNDLIRQQQLAKVRLLTPDDLPQKDLQRRAQVGSDRLVETGLALRVFGEIRILIHFEPLQQKLAHLRPGARVGNHPVGLL